MGTCGLHTAHNDFKHVEKTSDCTTHLWPKYSMKHLESALATNLLPKLWRSITPCNLSLTGGWKVMWLQKSKSDMVKNYWSSFLLAKSIQKQRVWAEKTGSQHELESFMQGCERLSCFSQTSIFSGSCQTIKLIFGSLPNWQVYGTISYGNIERRH